MPSPARLFNRFCAAGTNRRLDLSLSWQASKHSFLREHATYGHGPGITVSQKVLLLLGKAQLARCLKSMGKGSVEWSTGIQSP